MILNAARVFFSLVLRTFREFLGYETNFDTASSSCMSLVFSDPHIFSSPPIAPLGARRGVALYMEDFGGLYKATWEVPMRNPAYGVAFRLNDEPRRRLIYISHSSTNRSSSWLDLEYLDGRMEFWIGNLRMVFGIFEEYAPDSFFRGEMPGSRAMRMSHKALPPSRNELALYKGARCSSPPPARFRSQSLYPGYPLLSERCLVDITCECHSDPNFVCQSPCAQAYIAVNRAANGGICVFHWQRLHGSAFFQPIPEPQSGLPGQESESVSSHQGSMHIVSAYSSGSRTPYIVSSENSGPATPRQPTESFLRGLRGALLGDTPPSWSSSSLSNPESQQSRSPTIPSSTSRSERTPEEQHAAGILAELAFSSATGPPLDLAVGSAAAPPRASTPVPVASTLAVRDPTPPSTIAFPRSPNSPPTPFLPQRTDLAVAQVALSLWNAAQNPGSNCPDLGMTFHGDDVLFTTRT